MGHVNRCMDSHGSFGTKSVQVMQADTSNLCYFTHQVIDQDELK